MTMYWPSLVHVEFSKSDTDPQKLVTPGIVFTKVAEVEEDVVAGIIHLGWWHWSIDFYFAFIRIQINY